jgi:hypothetical protein
MNFSLRQAFNAGVATVWSAAAMSAAHAHHTEAMAVDIGVAVLNVVLAGMGNPKSKAPAP